DWYAPYGVAQLADPVQAQKPATSPRHVVRGGAWDASAAFEVRAADRHGYPVDFRFPHVGFRCASAARPQAR
ncbi:MAG: SUMF1/EgtB/PvdO family nonheme iron enzyme, partial [Polyangiaceae bacterium]|nr:SUMF1/EgtB/PvdO family nonheme iron enzyme [Polyangiaceae bacterium]